MSHQVAVSGAKQDPKEFAESVNLKIMQNATKAIVALQNFAQKKNERMKERGKVQLFPETTSGVSIIVTYKRVSLFQPHFRTMVKIPYCERTPENTSICLILFDLDRTKESRLNPDVDEQARKWLDILRERHPDNDFTNVTILTYIQLKREYSQPDAKRKFAQMYDVFVVDVLILEKVMKFMGRNFIQKRPLPIHAKRPRRFLEELTRVFNTLSLPLERLKDTVSVRIGNLAQPAEHLIGNAAALISALVKYCPGGAINIRSVFVDADNVRVPLPVYAEFGSPNDVDVNLPRINPRKEKIFEGELSTLPEGFVVKVHANGLVRVVDKRAVSHASEVPSSSDGFRDDFDVDEPTKIGSAANNSNNSKINADVLALSRKRKRIVGGERVKTS